jgi:hypothetical protein
LSLTVIVCIKPAEEYTLGFRIGPRTATFKPYSSFHYRYNPLEQVSKSPDNLNYCLFLLSCLLLSLQWNAFNQCHTSLHTDTAYRTSFTALRLHKNRSAGQRGNRLRLHTIALWPMRPVTLVKSFPVSCTQFSYHQYIAKS